FFSADDGAHGVEPWVLGPFPPASSADGASAGAGGQSSTDLLGPAPEVKSVLKSSGAAMSLAARPGVPTVATQSPDAAAHVLHRALANIFRDVIWWRHEWDL